MNRVIKPSQISGKLHAPASKSMTQRAIAAGLMAGGTTIIRNPSTCNDSLAALSIAEKLGATVHKDQHEIRITGIMNIPRNRSAGVGRDRPLQNDCDRPLQVNCGESGLAMRMFAPIASLFNYPVTFTGEGSLQNRPVDMIGKGLEQLGVDFSSSNGLLPFTVKGPLKGGTIQIDASDSSQLLSGLLIALPNCSDDSDLFVENLNSVPYIDMTLQLLSTFGITIDHQDYKRFHIPGNQIFSPVDYTVEGDWSNAAFLLVAGVINGSLEVSGLNFASRQADMNILEVLQQTGAMMIISGSSVTLSSSTLKAFRFDATHSPDLFPPLAALAAYCEGTSIISGVYRLIHKESNRSVSIPEVLGKMGITCSVAGNEMYIQGGRVQGATVWSHLDHRIAMMAAILALGASGTVTITGAECVNKSYPDFFHDLKVAGVKTD